MVLAWKLPFRICGLVDGQEIAESAADGIVDEHRGHAQRLCRRRNYGVELCFVGHVTDKGFGIFDLVFERGETLAIAGEHRDGVTACREPAGDCRASSCCIRISDATAPAAPGEGNPRKLK